MRAPLALFAPMLGLAVAWACNGNPELAVPMEASSTGTGGGLVDGGNGQGGGSGGQDGGTVTDAGSSPVLLGLTPNPLHDSLSASASERLHAELATYAAGVRTVFLDLPWNELNELTLGPRIAGYRERGLAVVVSLLVVDRNTDLRPESVALLNWDDSTTVDSLRIDLDKVLPLLDQPGDALVLGRRSDVFAGRIADATAFETFLTSAAIYIANQSPGLELGVGVSYVDDPSQIHTDLRSLGSVAVFSYLPGLGAPSVPTDTSVPDDLDAMVALAGERNVLLQAVGFTSSTELDGSEEAQAQFLTAFFNALSPRRARFPLVNLRQLHDVHETPCEAHAIMQEELPGDPYARYVCSLGLRDHNGAPKAAWETFVQASAAFASP